MRPPFGFAVDAPHVFTDDAQGGELDSAERHDGGQQGGVTGYADPVQRDTGDDPQCVSQRRQREGETGVDGQAQRAAVEGDQSVDPVVEQMPAAPFRTPRRPPDVPVGEGGGVEADQEKIPLENRLVSGSASTASTAVRDSSLKSPSPSTTDTSMHRPMAR